MHFFLQLLLQLQVLLCKLFDLSKSGMEDVHDNGEYIGFSSCSVEPSYKIVVWLPQLLIYIYIYIAYTVLPTNVLVGGKTHSN